MAETPRRYCRNCRQQLQPEEQVCPNCGRPEHETAHVPTPQADVPLSRPQAEADVPLPPPPQAETITETGEVTSAPPREEQAEAPLPQEEQAEKLPRRSARRALRFLLGGIGFFLVLLLASFLLRRWASGTNGKGRRGRLGAS